MIYLLLSNRPPVAERDDGKQAFCLFSLRLKGKALDSCRQINSLFQFFIQ